LEWYGIVVEVEIAREMLTGVDIGIDETERVENAPSAVSVSIFEDEDLTELEEETGMDVEAATGTTVTTLTCVTTCTDDEEDDTA